MNREQMQALGRVLEHFEHDDVKHYEEAGRPPGHFAEALLALDNYRQARSLEMDDDSKGKATRDDGTGYPTAGTPIGIVRDHPSHDEDLATEHRIIWNLLPLAKLPAPIENLVRDAVLQKSPELRAPVVAMLETIMKERDPGDEIPF